MADIYDAVYENEDTDSDILWRYNFYMEYVIPRVSNFFQLNLYQDYDFFLKHLENTVLWGFIKKEQNFVGMHYDSPNMEKIINNYANFYSLVANQDIAYNNLWNFYRELEAPFPHILHGYSEDYKAKTMLVCQAYNKTFHLALNKVVMLFKFNFKLGKK